MDALRIKCNKAGREVGTKGGWEKNKMQRQQARLDSACKQMGFFFSGGKRGGGGLGLLWMHTNTNIDFPGAQLDKKEPCLFVIKGASKQGQACPSKYHIFCPFVYVHVSVRTNLSLK